MKKIIYFIQLVLLVIKNIVMSNLKLAFHLLFMPHIFSPDLMEIKVDNLKRYPTFVLFNLISMTPGTLSVRFEEDRSVILVHTLYGGDNQKYNILKDITYMQHFIEKAF